MSSAAGAFPNLTVGLDLGDKRSVTCAVNAAGEVVQRGEVLTTPEGMRTWFGARAPCRVVLEVGTHSPWVSRGLAALGHEVVVANPSAVYGTRRRKKRNDRLDAEFLARQGRADVALLAPIQHRGEDTQAHLSLLRARDQVVRCRTRLITHVRGSVKPFGSRLPACSAEAFAERAAGRLPAPLAASLAPVVETIRELTQRIRGYDRQLEGLVRQHYPAAQHLQQVAGVGTVTSLGYVLLVEDPARFAQSRDVGPYFGLVRRLDDSSDSAPELPITHAGDELGRRLLVSAAQYILGPFGPPCDLRRHGEAIAARGGKNAKKRAVVAVARKLAVLLHRLWVSGAPYDPEYLLKRRAA